MSETAKVFGCWADGEAASAAGPLFFDARLAAPADCRGLAVIVDEASCDAALGMLASGALRAFVAGTSATVGPQVARLARQVGGGRIGVWADAVPMEARWRLETESNADFKTLTSSMPEACWELLDGGGERTGVRLDYWIERMFGLGAGAAIVRTDLAQASDRDLNVCAGLVERFGERLWLAPSSPSECALEPWITYGQARRFVLPPAWRTAALDGARQEEARAA